MQKDLVYFSIAAAVIALTGGVVHAGEMEDRQTAHLADSCATCHGTDGLLASGIQPLAGKPAAVLSAQLLAFKANEMPNTTVMDRITAGYSEAELRALADHFSAIGE